jgi:quinol monooxygenase YgiN
MYAAILHVSFPAEKKAEVVDFLRTEMLPVISGNPGFVDFRVLDGGTPGELVMIDTWRCQEDSAEAARRPDAAAVHDRYSDLGIKVTSASRHDVIVTPASGHRRG